MIKVKLYSIFRDVVGKDELIVDLNEVTGKELLDMLFKRFSDQLEKEDMQQTVIHRTSLCTFMEECST